MNTKKRLTNSEKSLLKSKHGEWAVVTGASSGIGLQLCTLLAEAGFNLVVHSRNQVRLAEVEKQLTVNKTVEIKIVASDVSVPEGVEKAIGACTGLNVGLLIVSAGFGTSGLFMDASIKEEVNMLHVNCEALLALTHYFGNRFAQQRRGGIILMSSVVAFQGVPYAALYAATKAYVQSLAEGLAAALKPVGVDVLAAAPGPVQSGFSERANMKMSFALKPSEIGVPILRALGNKTTVLPGLLTKVLVYSLAMVPRPIKTKIMKLVMGGMTAHQMK